jgi:hypothetical protein
VDGDGRGGGGLEMYHCEGDGVSVIEGNLFLNNDADVWGGGLLNVDSSPVIRNNTFVGNGGFNRAAIWVLGGFPPSLPLIGDNICWNIDQSTPSNCPSPTGLRVENPLV